jgi:hypothetical protein
MLARVADYAAVGTTHLLLDITGDSVDGLIRDMERFAEEVVPAVAA